MAKEIERKFLIKPQYSGQDFDYNGCPRKLIEQGYFNRKDPCVRVRICELPGHVYEAFITIKSKDQGIEDFEFEYPIPTSDAREMISLYCGQRIVKKERFFVNHNNLVWTADFFQGPNHGLAIAEIELEHRDQEFALPNWVGKEVTDNPKYKNYKLALKNEK